MATVSPTYETKRAYGGFLDRLFQNLPKPFSADPKAAVALNLVPAGTPLFPYLSVRDQTLYFHSVPLDSPAPAPSVTFDLSANSVGTLAAAITAAGLGFTAMSVGTQDGTTAALMLDFTDFIPAPGSTIALHIATSKNRKFFHPIANLLKEAGDDADTAERMMYLPYAAGFWLDFWGDWTNIPRLPGMTDSQYVAYLLWTIRTPNVTNMAMEDTLSFRYQAPIQVVDTGLYQFTLELDPALMTTLPTQVLAPVVNKIKAAGTSWNVNYIGNYKEDFKAYYSGRWNGADFRTSDTLGITIPMPSEGRYGYNPTGFLTNSSPLNDTTLGFGRTMKEKIVMYYNSPTDPSYTAFN